MKKVLSLVLVIAMILGSFTMVFASQYSDVKDTANYAEAVSVLSGLGVVGGFPDGTFKPEEGVTRAQMATMIVNALGLPVSGQSLTKFSDVPRDHWASGYIRLAESMGFIAGYTDGTFQPEKKVSYDEAITMLVASLGYSADSLTGTWPGAFVNKANSLGILDLCKKTGDAFAPRGDIANLLYKTLTCWIGYVDKDGAWHANAAKDGTYNDSMMLRLGALDYNAGNPFVVDEDIADEAAINILGYLGAYVTAYCNEDNEIIAIKEVKSEFIEGDYDDLDDDYKVSAATIDGAFIKFNNGETAGYAMPTTGEMKLAVAMSGTKAKTIYSAQIWTPAATERVEDDVQEVIEEDAKLCGEKFALDEDDEIDLNSFAIFGRDALKDIQEDDIVTVYTNAAGKIVRIEVGTKQVEGTVTKINAAHTKYTIAGTAYAISGTGFGYTEMNDLMKDETSATFYLDYNGEIFDYDPEEAETTDGYGVVLMDWDETVKGETTYYMEILLADGTTKEFEYDKAKVTAPGNGKLAYYELDEDDIVIDLKPAAGTPKTISVSKNGVSDGNRFNSSSVVFKYTGKAGDEKKASKYSVIDAATFYGKDVENVIFIANSSKVVKAAIVGSTVAEADTNLAYFVKKNAETASGVEYTVLYKGEVQTLTAKSGVVSDTDIDKTGAKPFTLTFNSSNVITAIDPGTIKGATLNVADLDTKGTSVSGSVFTSTDKSSYDLDADIVVYLNDDGSWSAKSTSALAAKKGAYTAMVLYDIDDDGDFDQAIITK